MNTLKNIFSEKSNIDSKCKINRSDKTVNQKTLDCIEQGITSEQLDQIGRDLPIKKYITQVTIHGKFSKISNNHILGYKNIFQNKNGSVGIKYNAIDESKRQRIKERLKWLGLIYFRNSEETKFQKKIRLNENNFKNAKNELMSLAEKIDTNLFFGGYNIFIGEAWGMKYLVLDLSINAIYDKNIETFLNKIGAKKEYCRQKEQERENQEKKLQEKRQQEEQEKERKKQELWNNLDLSLLNVYNQVEKTSKPGLYLKIKTETILEVKIKFEIVYVYTLPGKKKPRFNKTSYESLSEALKHEPKQEFNDNVFNGYITGYKIK